MDSSKILLQKPCGPEYFGRGERFFEIFKVGLEKILSEILPNECAVCGKTIPAFELLCDECRDSLKGPYPLPVNRHDHTLYHFGEYSGTLKKVILSYKSGRWRLKEVITDLYLRMWGYFQPDIESIVYIPSGYESLEERGFDHMELIARNLSSRIGITSIKALVNLSSVRQKSYGRSERLANVGRFKCLKNPGASVLLLDDVLTTGSTVNDAVSSLKRCGVVDVHVFVLAKV